MPSLSQRLRQSLSPIKPVVVYSDDSLRAPVPSNWVVGLKVKDDDGAGTWANLTLPSVFAPELLQAEMQQAMPVNPYRTFPLALDLETLERARLALGDRLEQLSTGADTDLAKFRAGAKAQATAGPKKIIIDDSQPTPKKPRRKTTP